MHLLLVSAGAFALAVAGFGDGSRTFGGQVLQVGPKAGTFVMQGGASKRYPRVTIVYDARTRWLGVSRPDRRLRVGDPLRVTAAPAGGGTFRAGSIEIEPIGARPTRGHFGATRP